jgi:hypothetical protein
VEAGISVFGKGSTWEIHFEPMGFWDPSPASWASDDFVDADATPAEVMQAWFAGAETFKTRQKKVLHLPDTLEIRTDSQGYGGSGQITVRREVPQEDHKPGRFYVRPVLDTVWFREDGETEYLEDFIAEGGFEMDIEELKEVMRGVEDGWGTNVSTYFYVGSFEELLAKLDIVQLEAEAHDQDRDLDFFVEHGHSSKARRMTLASKKYALLAPDAKGLQLPARARHVRRIVSSMLGLLQLHFNVWPSEILDLVRALHTGGRDDTARAVLALRRRTLERSWLMASLSEIFDHAITALTVTHVPSLTESKFDGISPAGALYRMAEAVAKVVVANGISDRGLGTFEDVLRVTTPRIQAPRRPR